MDIERRAQPGNAVSPSPKPSNAGVIAMGALAALGLITVAQWLMASVLGIIKVALVVAVLLAAGAWLINAKGSR